MSYKCRDCGSNVKIVPDYPTEKCPKCGSIYLIPQNIEVKITQKKKPKVTLGDRLLSSLFGGFLGLITFFIWAVLIMAKGGGSVGKGSAIMFVSGIHFSVYLAVVLGLIGFIVGPDKLFNLFGILWGTDNDFHQKVDSNIYNFFNNIPQWVIYTLLGVIILGVYSYMALLLSG